MSTVLKFNKCETCQPKIANPLTIERYVLVGCYFYTHVSRLLSFDMNDVRTEEVPMLSGPRPRHDSPTQRTRPHTSRQPIRRD